MLKGDGNLGRRTVMFLYLDQLLLKDWWRSPESVLLTSKEKEDCLSRTRLRFGECFLLMLRLEEEEETDRPTYTQMHFSNDAKLYCDIVDFWKDNLSAFGKFSGP